MAQQVPRLWLSRAERSPRGGRKRRAWQLPRRAQPHLEILEGRCLPSTVMNLNDSGAGSLRQAIMDTPAGGTVDFQAGLSGTITLTTGELLIDHNMTIAGPGAEVVTVSGNHMSRVVEIAHDITVPMSALTLADGQVIVGQFLGGGGAIYNDGVLTISHARLTANSVQASLRYSAGGAIFSTGMLDLTDCTVDSNSAESTLSGMTNAAGGGLYNAGTAHVTGSIFDSNSVRGRGDFAVFTPSFGGGIFNAGMLGVAFSTIKNNSAVGFGLHGLAEGGGVYNGGSLAIDSSALTGNTANGTGIGRIGEGGGLFTAGPATAENSTIADNIASLGGGGIYNGALMTANHMTISGNSANGGRGITNSGTFNIYDTVLAANNQGAFGSEISGPVTSQGHNLIGDGTGGSGYDATDLVGTSDNPIDPLLAPLADNGGPTQTMALLPGSPAFGAGDPTDAPMWDQRGPGFPRVINGRIDIGAFEVQENPNPENPIHGGFDAFALPPCDDCSSPATSLGFTFNFFGVRRDTVWVNNNGNLTFDSAFSSFLPGPVDGVGQPILAPFWADVYTNGNNLGRVTYGRGTLDGDPAFGATWENVAHYLPDGTANYFQVVIIDHSERGFQEVQFNYLTIGWDHTDSSELAPRVGYSNAAGASGELPGSGTFDTLVDSGSQSLRLLRRYTLIVYPFTVVSGFTGDFVHFAASGSGNQPTSMPLVAFGAIDERVAVPNLQGTTATSAAASTSPPSNRVSWPTILPRLEAVPAHDATALLDLVWADDRLLM